MGTSSLVKIVPLPWRSKQGRWSPETFRSRGLQLPLYQSPAVVAFDCMQVMQVLVVTPRPEILAEEAHGNPCLGV